MSFPKMDMPVAIDDIPGLNNKWLFVGIDLAPVDTLETGIAVIDRKRQLMRMEKVEHDKDIFLFLENLGPKDSMIIALDIPKSLSFTSKWRQQQIKMHPLRLLNNEPASSQNRFSKRATDFYQRASNQGFMVVNFFSHYAKMRYNLNVPFKSRSPQGCRALQAAIKERLCIGQLPANLVPSSVLDAMVGAYLSWTLYAYPERLRLIEARQQKAMRQLPVPELPFQLYRDENTRLYADPLKLLSLPRLR